MKYILLAMLLLHSIQSIAQTGIVKGIVFDKQSESPLEGAIFELLQMDNATGVITDFDGYFTLIDVPIGRQIIRVSYIGFESTTIPNIEVSTGKDNFITVSLTETFNQLDEVVLTANTNRTYPTNHSRG